MTKSVETTKVWGQLMKISQPFRKEALLTGRSRLGLFYHFSNRVVILGHSVSVVVNREREFKRGECLGT